MILKPWQADYSIVKIFGCGENKRIKITTLNLSKIPGFELDDNFYKSDGTELKKLLPISENFVFDDEYKSANESKLENNICRAKNKIFELAFCNSWKYFFTGTINPKKYNRSDLQTFYKDFSEFIHNKNKHLENPIKYLFIPELHSDGHSWHLHGFISDLPSNSLEAFKSSDFLPYHILQKLKKGHPVYKWTEYQNKFGFCNLELIENPEAVSKYITKYINKNLALSVTTLGAHLYYHSKGLKFAEVVCKGVIYRGFEYNEDIQKICTAGTVQKYAWDYGCSYWCSYSPELLSALSSSLL